jgi:magnesium chelatase subunit I
VGLFNLMEERDIRIRGYRVRLPLDVLIFATANPEDYTNRGRIITPLKDRYGAQVRTHYPLNTSDELAIVEQERTRLANGQARVRFPDYMAEIVGEITALARRDPEINQRSGVSVRVSIANYETLHSAALRRALRHQEDISAPRITDLPAILASMRGKIELESIEEGREAKLIEEITDRAVMAVFERRFRPDETRDAAAAFEQGLSVVTGADRPSSEYSEAAEKAGLQPMLMKLGGARSPAEMASAAEFVLEGLHLAQRLNRERVPGGFAYTWGVMPSSGPADPALRRRDLYGRRRPRGT